MAELEEIIVKAKRRPPKPPPDPTRQRDSFGSTRSFYSCLGAFGRSFDYGRDRQTPTPPKVIDEIVVKAKKKKRPGIFATAAAMTRSQMLGIGRTATRVAEPILSAADITKFQADMLRQSIPEIVVKGKRLRTATAFASRLAFPVTVAEAGGRLTSAIIRELQRQAFDELGRYITQTVRPGPDTRLRTIPQPRPEPEPQPAPQMEEIVVTARRPRSLPFAEPLTNLLDAQWFANEMTRNMQADAASAAATRERLKTPTIPRVRTRTRTQTIPQISTLVSTLPRTRVKRITLPITATATRRSTLLGIGTGTTLGVATAAVTMTQAQTQSQLQQTTRVGQRTKYCRPCPRKKKKKKQRTKCYKKLIEEKTNPSRDKVFKWNRIDCRTGRELT